MPEDLQIIACFGIDNLIEWQKYDFLPAHIEQTGFKKNINCAIKNKDKYTIQPNGICVWQNGSFNYMWDHSLSEPLSVSLSDSD